LTKDFLAEVDIARGGVAGWASVGYHTLEVSEMQNRFVDKLPKKSKFKKWTYSSLGTRVGVSDGDPLTAVGSSIVELVVHGTDVVVVTARQRQLDATASGG
jgi:hypothetical protein